jgi:hypothetical protein
MFTAYVLMRDTSRCSILDLNDHPFSGEAVMSTVQPPAPHPVESSDERLDEALCETFPASDPIAVDATEPVQARDDSNAGRLKPKRSSPADTPAR